MPTWSVMGGKREALVGGSGVPCSAEDGWLFPERALPLGSIVMAWLPPGAWGRSDTDLFEVSFVSETSDFSKMDAFSDTSLLS